MLTFVYVGWVGGQSNVYVNIFENLFQFGSYHIERHEANFGQCPQRNKRQFSKIYVFLCFLLV